MNQHPFNLSSMLVKAEADAKQAHARNDELVSERFALKRDLDTARTALAQERASNEAAARGTNSKIEELEQEVASMTAKRDDQRDAARQWEKTSCAWQMAHDRVAAERDALRDWQTLTGALPIRVTSSELQSERERERAKVSQQLREWARTELTGYPRHEDAAHALRWAADELDRPPAEPKPGDGEGKT